MKPPGDPGQIGAAAGPWQSASDAVSHWQGQLEGSLPSDWSGDAANAFHTDWTDLKGKMGRGVAGLHGGGGALRELSSNLSAAQGEWTRAASAASAAGLTLHDDGSIDRMGSPAGTVDGGAAAVTDPTVHGAVLSVISGGRQAELDAMMAQRLAAAKFEAVASIAYGADLGQAMAILGYGLGAVGSGGSVLEKRLQGLEDTTKKAEGLYKDATAAAQMGKSNASELGKMMHSRDPAERSFAAGRLKQAGQDAKALFADASKASGALDGAKGAEAALRDPAWSKFMKAVEIGKGIPVIDLVANGLGFASDMMGGNSWQEAATRTGLSYGAGLGTAALVSMATGALLTPGLGEVIIVGAAAGLVAYGVDLGVEYVWNHWSGISHGISSAAHSVGSFFSSIF
jgi:hypothetical protein